MGCSTRDKDVKCSWLGPCPVLAPMLACTSLGAPTLRLLPPVGVRRAVGVVAAVVGVPLLEQAGQRGGHPAQPQQHGGESLYRSLLKILFLPYIRTQCLHKVIEADFCFLHSS